MVYANKMAAVYAKAQKQLGQFFDGICTVYALQAREQDGVWYGEDAGWEALEEMTGLPCHLAWLQQGPAATGAGADGSYVDARGRLFLPPEFMVPAGSRVQVEQQEQVFWLDCSGLPVRYPTHTEVETRLLDKRA